MLSMIGHELRGWIKSKIIFLYCAVLIVYCAANHAWSVYHLFAGECDWIRKLSEAAGKTVRETVQAGASEEILHYAYLLSEKSSFLFPLYMYGKFAVLLFVPLVCLMLYREMESRVAMQRVTYHGSFRYCLSKAGACALLAGLCFAVMGAVCAAGSVLYRADLLKDSIRAEVLAVCQEQIPFALTGFIAALITVMLIIGGFAFFAAAFGYALSIPQAGLLLPFVSVPKWEVGLFRSVWLTVDSLFCRMLPTMRIGSYLLISDAAAARNGTVSCYIWLLLLFVPGFLLLKCKKQYDY